MAIDSDRMDAIMRGEIDFTPVDMLDCSPEQREEYQKLTEATNLKQEDFTLNPKHNCPEDCKDLKGQAYHDLHFFDVPAPTDQGKWIQMTPMVRVLLEMPEEQALWLRNRLGEIRASKKGGMLGIDAGDETMKGVDMYIREILIYG